MATGIRIGILGLGPAGTALVPQIDADPRFVFVAGCDPRPGAFAGYSARPALRQYTDLATFLADPAIDVVYVATPTPLHAAHTCAALGAGKHVVCEKPMAVTVAEARAMTQAARTAQRLLLVGHSQSFEATIRVMRALIDHGRLGRLRALNNWCYTDWMYKPRDPAEFDRAQGGGVVYRQAAHQIDILRYLTRTSPLAVQAVVGDWDPRRPGDGSYSAQLIFPERVVGSLFYSGYDHFAATELTFGLGPSGTKDAPSYGKSRRQALGPPAAGIPDATETARKYAAPEQSRRHSMLTPGISAAFGILVVSCERGDLRVCDEGVQVYDDTGRWVLPVAGLPNGRRGDRRAVGRGPRGPGAPARRALVARHGGGLPGAAGIGARRHRYHAQAPDRRLRN